MFLGSTTLNGVVGAGAQVNEYIVEIAHGVLVLAEGRHHVFGRRSDVLAPACEFAAAQPFQRILNSPLTKSPLADSLLRRGDSEGTA